MHVSCWSHLDSTRRFTGASVMLEPELGIHKLASWTTLAFELIWKSTDNMISEPRAQLIIFTTVEETNTDLYDWLLVWTFIRCDQMVRTDCYSGLFKQVSTPTCSVFLNDIYSLWSQPSRCENMILIHWMFFYLFSSQKTNVSSLDFNSLNCIFINAQTHLTYCLFKRCKHVKSLRGRRLTSRLF